MMRLSIIISLFVMLSYVNAFTLTMGINPKPSGIANTKQGKTAILERTKKLIDSSALIISFPISGATKEQVDILRKSLPKTVKATVIKNSLLRKSVEGTQFEPIGSKIKNSNMFFFIPEGDAKVTFDKFKAWQKETKRTDAELAAKYASMEGQLYEAKQIESVVNLPTKKELMTKVALTLKMVPIKLAKSIIAVPEKVGRVINEVKKQKESEEKAGAA